MIISKDESDICLESIIDSSYPMFFGIDNDNLLLLQNHWTSNLYLAYFKGIWYASNCDTTGASKFRPKGPQVFFAYGDGVYLEAKGKFKSERAEANIPLSAGTHSYLLVFYNKKIGVVIADGRRSETVIMEEFDATHGLWKILLLSFCSMIRQHDSTASNEIEEFFNICKEEPILEKPEKIRKPNVFEKEMASCGT